MKLHWLPCISLIALLTVSAGCFRKDVRTIDVSVPQMRSADCGKIIQDALAKTDGIKSAQPDLNRKVLVIEYEALKLGIKNIEFVIAGVGFDANDVEAPIEVRTNLPAGCR